jgi:hypothetical protein
MSKLLFWGGKFMKRKILVPVCGDGKGGNVLACAVALARGFNARIEAAI